MSHLKFGADGITRFYVDATLTYPLNLFSKRHLIEITQSSIGIRESSWERYSDILVLVLNSFVFLKCKTVGDHVVSVANV